MNNQLIKAKIPCPETGIEIKKSMCDICTPGLQCGVDVYVKDGKMLKLEGTKGFPGSGGKLCAKGAAGRQFQYNAARLTTPLKRAGGRGDGKYVPISWDEALDICAEKFLDIRKEYGPEAVIWACGYSKWFRPWLHRLTHSFGSMNYTTESSSCHRTEVMSYKTLFGSMMRADIPHASLVITWGSNGLANNFAMGKDLMMLKKRGGRIITIDPRVTHVAQKLADIHIRPRIGTDGFLANAMAHHMIENNLINKDFIEKYVHGFDEYSKMVKDYTPELAQEKNGVSADLIREIAELFAKEPGAVILLGNGLTHRRDGYNMHRAILSLMVLVGRIDTAGGYFPVHETFCMGTGGFVDRQEEYIDDVKPADCLPPIGKGRFPLWFEYINEAQGMDLMRQIRTGDPYQLKALAAFGVNYKMYPESEKFLETLKQLDFIMATDVMDSKICQIADIILPVKTSYERGEAKCYAGKFVNWTRPAVDPVGNLKDDVEVITELAKRMDLDDSLLKEGYEGGVKYMMAGCGIEDWESVKDAELPVPIPASGSYVPGSYLENRKNTISGKIELYSETVAKYKEYGLNPLPVCDESMLLEDREEYPFTMMTGARIATAIHSRTTHLSWLRSQTKDPAVRMNPQDAALLGIKDGEIVRVSTKAGSLLMPVQLTEEYNAGEVGMYHGFDEANANSLLGEDMLDPYSGFPAYKQYQCRVEKF